MNILFHLCITNLKKLDTTYLLCMTNQNKHNVIYLLRMTNKNQHNVIYLRFMTNQPNTMTNIFYSCLTKTNAFQCSCCSYVFPLKLMCFSWFRLVTRICFSKSIHDFLTPWCYFIFHLTSWIHHFQYKGLHQSKHIFLFVNLTNWQFLPFGWRVKHTLTTYYILNYSGQHYNAIQCLNIYV